MPISFSAAAGAFLTIGLIFFVGIMAKRRVLNANDFMTGSNMGMPMIAGSLVGTLVGGASTIGTAQLAFTYGFSAWWFTLGGGIGLLILSLLFTKPIYQSGLCTIPQILKKEYGNKTALMAAVFMSVGTFMSVVPQLLSGVALLSAFGGMGPVWALVCVVLLMLTYVIFGGAFGAGLLGIVKTLLLYLSVIVCGAVSLKLGGGLSQLYKTLPSQQYFNLFSRGVWKDAGAGASLLFGVLTTQAYILPVVSGKNLKTSKRGALLGSVLTSLIGIAGIFVGMFMKIQMPHIDSASAMPLFVLNYLPDFLGGVILATLLIALVGTGAGLALGISTTVSNDIVKPRLGFNVPDKTLLRISRGIIAGIFVLAAIICLSDTGAVILSWSFLAMGLRGAVGFAPLCFALFLPGRLLGRFAAAAVVAGPILVLTGSFFLPKEIDPLFLGMAAAVLICISGAFLQARKNNSVSFDQEKGIKELPDPFTGESVKASKK